MAIFDDDRTKNVETVDESDQVGQVLQLSAAEVASYLPALYLANAPQVPDATSALLKGAQLYYARVLSYQRRPEFVKTYGAQPSGPMEKLFHEKMSRIQSSIQQIPPDDNGPPVDPPNVGATILSDDSRMIINSVDGTDNLGDF